MVATVQLVMAGLLFFIGILMIGSGLLIILAKEYQETMRMLSSQAPKLAGKAATEGAVLAALDGTTRLLDAVTRLIQTAVGVGAFLCLLGLVICSIAFYMATFAT